MTTPAPAGTRERPGPADARRGLRADRAGTRQHPVRPRRRRPGRDQEEQKENVGEDRDPRMLGANACGPVPAGAMAAQDLSWRTGRVAAGGTATLDKLVRIEELVIEAYAD